MADANQETSRSTFYFIQGVTADGTMPLRAYVLRPVRTDSNNISEEIQGIFTKPAKNHHEWSGPLSLDDILPQGRYNLKVIQKQA